MSDLISRQDAINAVTEVDMQVYEGVAAVGRRFYLTQDEMIAIIESLPSVEPERKKGKWSNYKDEHCCSVCKCVVISNCWDDEIRYDYCPYCGSEME